MDLEMIYTDYCDLRAITSSIVNTNIVNKNPNGIMPRSIVDLILIILYYL